MGHLYTENRGNYDFIQAVDEVTAEAFRSLYSKLFVERTGCDKLIFVIDIAEHPSVLGMEDFSFILQEADRNKIGHIEMLVFSLDASRPLIGEMIHHLARDFTVTINVSFYTSLEDAQKAVESLL